MASVNYEDQRFQDVKNKEQQALTNVNNMYNNMVSESNQYYQDQINAAQEYGDKQAQIQQANTDFAIDKIEQQKAQTEKDYLKEQKGAYVDWQKQSNAYGAEAEKLARNGLLNSGYSESSQVAMYTAYQNRVAQARDTYNKAVLEYDNGIKEAQLTNNAALAEIAFNALKTKLSLSLEGFQYKNSLLQQQLAAQNQVSDRYYNRWQDVLSQINTENALAEQQRQFNASLAARGGSGGGSGGYTIDANGNYVLSGNESGGKQSVIGTALNAAKKAVAATVQTNPVKSAANKVANTVANAMLKNKTYSGTELRNNGGETTGRMVMVNGEPQNEWKLNGHYYVYDKNVKAYVMTK